MNVLWKTFSQTVIGTASLASQLTNSVFKRNDFRIQEFIQSIALKNTLNRMHKLGGHPPKRERKSVLEGKPFAKGIIIKTIIKKPKKPNSGNRKCVVVKLSTGREMTAYIPEEGHNLQEHQFVLVRPGNIKDLPGVKIKCVRGVYDLPHKKASADK